MKIISYFRLRSCFELFEMFFEVKKSSFYSRFFSQTAPLAIFLGRSGRTGSFSLSTQEEAVEPEVFHSQPSART